MFGFRAVVGSDAHLVTVADRRHLWHNLREKASEAITAHLPGAPPRQPRASRAPARSRAAAPPPGAGPGLSPGPHGPKLSLAERTRLRHAEVAQLTAAGHSLSAAKLTGTKEEL